MSGWTSLCDSVLWLWKGKSPMRHIEQGEEKRFLCGRIIGRSYELDSSEMTFDQMLALVREPANARYMCDGCAAAIRTAAPQPPVDAPRQGE